MGSKVAAYITVYEDRDAAIRCIEAIRRQSIAVDSVFIFDNSQTEIFNSVDSWILSHHSPFNMGISQGLILGLEWAIRNDYDFLWTFDQDSTPSNKCLELLLQEYERLVDNDQRIGIIAPTAYDHRSGNIIGGVNFAKDRLTHFTKDTTEEIYECDAPITSGSLIDLKSAKSTELPLIDLFIDGVDFDYGLKFKRQGFKNFIVTKAKLEHNYANPTNFKVLNFDWVFHSYSPMRYYYSCRNTTYLAIYYSEGGYKFTASLHRLKTMLLKTIAIAFFEKEKKIEKIYACLLGTYHGFIKKLGKTWQ